MRLGFVNRAQVGGVKVNLAAMNLALNVLRVGKEFVMLAVVWFVVLGSTKVIMVHHFVCHAFQERMETIPVQQNVKIAAVGSIKMHLVMIRVWIAKWANT